jgi:hypothetical protein
MSVIQVVPVIMAGTFGRALLLTPGSGIAIVRPALP